MLATIASLSDEGLRDAREHYATLLEARPKPHVLDDATIVRTGVYREFMRKTGVRPDAGKRRINA